MLKLHDFGAGAKVIGTGAGRDTQVLGGIGASWEHLITATSLCPAILALGKSRQMAGAQWRIYRNGAIGGGGWLEGRPGAGPTHSPARGYGGAL